MKPDVYVATPLHDDRVDFRYMAGMLSVVAKWGPARVAMGGRSGSFLPKLRDLLTVDFLRSGAKFMLCVDSDQGWNVNHLEALMAYDVDAISALVSRKEIHNRVMPAEWSGERGVVDGGKTLIGAHYVGAGFLLLRRNAVLNMFEHYRETLAYSADGKDIKNGMVVVLWAPMCHESGVIYLGEDFSFCKRFTDIGGKFWVDPSVQVEHVGKFVYTPDLEKCQALWAEDPILEGAPLHAEKH
jgi:hypothetical protein